MSEQMEALIKEVAIQHGVVVGRNDPILILHTLNARLVEDNTRAQQVMLNEYKEEMEGIALRWGNDAKEKSERILNASLAASKEIMVQLLQESTKSTIAAIKQEVDESLSRANSVLCTTKRVAWLNFTASAVTLLAACVVIIGVFFR